MAHLDGCGRWHLLESQQSWRSRNRQEGQGKVFRWWRLEVGEPVNPHPGVDARRSWPQPRQKTWFPGFDIRPSIVAEFLA